MQFPLFIVKIHFDRREWIDVNDSSYFLGQVGGSEKHKQCLLNKNAGDRKAVGKAKSG